MKPLLKNSISFFIFAFVLLCSINTLGFNANTDSLKKENVLKLNLLSLPLKTIAVQGEMTINRRWSFCLGLAYMPNRDLPFGAGNYIKPFFTNTKFNALLITPEVRYYPIKKQSATNGFYLAGYLRYKHTNFTTSFAFVDSSSTSYVFPIHYGADAIALGGMLGYQFKVKRFSLDFWVIGVHGGYQQSDVDIDITGLTVLLDKPEVKEQMDKAFNNSDVPRWLKNEAKNYLAQNAVAFSWSQPYVGIRSGITIGFRF